MAEPTFNPSAFANEMQIRTRKERNFERVESDLPDPKSVAFSLSHRPLSLSSLGSLINKVANLFPFEKAVTARDTVWLFDNTAYQTAQGKWEAEFVAAVFEQDVKCKVVDVATGVAKQLGLTDDDAEERKTIEERLLPFLWDVQVARAMQIEQQGQEDKSADVKLGPTNVNGIAANVLAVKDVDEGKIVGATTKVPKGTQGILNMETVYAGPEGWSVISDIDDTIKVTLTSDPLGILRSTFVDPPTAIRGMPELYKSMASNLPSDTPWFYLSASPYNLYPLLRDFRDEHFPKGTMILRDSSWRTVAGLLSTLTMGTEEYKVDRMQKIQSWFPKRKMILIGDSTQSDPESYGEIYRTMPGWVKLILIRKATDIASFGIEEKNQPKRFERAFKDVPREAWYVFEEPEEVDGIVKDVIARG